MKLLWRSLRGLLAHQRILYGLTAAGVALGVAAVVSIQIINQNALATFGASVRAVSLDADIIVRTAEVPLDERLLAEVLSDPAVRYARPVHRVEVAYFKATDEKIFLDVLGVDLSAPGRLPLNGAPDSLGEILAVRGWTAVTPELARDLNLTSPSVGASEGTAFEVVAGTEAVSLVTGATVDFRRVAPLASSRVLLMDIAQSQDLFDERGVIDDINVFLVEGAELDPTVARLREALGERAAVTTPGEREEQADGLLSAFRLNLTALSLISLLVGLFLVYTSVQASLVRRRRELGVLRSMGATKGQVLRLLLSEAAAVGLVGTAVGLPVGYLAATFNVDAVSGTLRDIYLLDEIEQLAVPVWIYFLAAALGLGGAMLGSLLPSLDAVAREPRELLGRAQLSERSSRLAPRLALIGFVVALLTLGWYALFGQGISYAGFVLAVSLLLVIPALSPWLLQTVASWSPASRLGASYAVRTLQSGRAQSSGLTVAALGIAFSMLVAITLMIGSFRATLEVWIDQVVIADVFVSTATSEHGSRTAGFPAEVIEQVRSRDGVRYADGIRRREGTANGRGVRIVAVDLSVPNAVERYPIFDGVADADALVRGDAVLVTEPFARKSGTWSGDTVTLDTASGEKTLSVSGVFYDYSTERGVVYMHLDTYAELFGAGQPIGLALYLEDGVDPEAVVRDLQTNLAVPGLYARSNQTLRTRVFEIFEQTFAITRLLQGMSLVIAAFGITLTLFVIAGERRAELALYRALGATRRQVFRLFVGKGVALGGLGTGIGVVGGTLLAGILVFIINRELFGWTIQVYVPWWALAEQIVTVGAVALVAAAVPALRASETPAGELTRDAT